MISSERKLPKLTKERKDDLSSLMFVQDEAANTFGANDALTILRYPMQFLDVKLELTELTSF